VTSRDGSERTGSKTSRRSIGLVALAVASELLGLAMGEWFWGIYRQTVPPALTTSFNVSTAHGWFLMNGALAGLAFFLWALLAVWLAPLFRKSRPPA
jgi:hypothetical protein